MSASDGQGENSRTGAEGAHQLGALIAGARKLAKEGDYETAVGQLELALDINPASSEARDLLTSWRDTLTSRPRELRIEKLLTQAESCLERGKTGKAKETAERILEIDPDHQTALGLLDRIFDAGDEPLDQSWEPVPLPPEEELGEKSLRLIERIKGLLARPTGPEPAAVAASQIVLRIEDRDLDGARGLLNEAAGEFPEAEEIDTVRERLQALEQQVRELLKGARGRLEKEDYENATRQLDEVAKLTREPREARDLRSAVKAGLEAQRQAKERSQAVDEVRRLLEADQLEEAQKRLLEAEKKWRKAGELAQLRDRFRQRQSERREARALVAEAQGLYAAGLYDEVLEVLVRAQPLDPRSQELQELRARAQGAIDRRLQEPRVVVQPARPRQGLVLALGVLAVVVVVLLSIMAIPEDNGVVEPPPPPPGTGSIKVTLSSPGRTMLDDFDLPEEGQSVTQVHHFRDVPTGSHTITIWRPGDPDRKTRNVTVEGGKTIELKE